MFFPTLLLSFSSFAVSPPQQQGELPENGFTKTYVIKADSAWLEDGVSVSPAFIKVTAGQIDWISSTDRRRDTKNLLGRPNPKPPLISVKGTLAPGIVDAWASFAPNGYMGDRRNPALRDVRESIPVQVKLADSQLYSQVVAAREAGVAASYMSPSWGSVRLGIGTPVEFTILDLPLVAGKPMLDFAVGASGSNGDVFSATNNAKELYGEFVAAREWRESLDEYDEKLEEFPEKLEKYDEKLKKYIEDKKAQEESGETPEKGKELKFPKRPKPPKAPQSDPETELLLAAMDGFYTLRVHAERLPDIHTILQLKNEFNLDVILLGAFEADLVADELRKANVPVVLAATPSHHSDKSERSFYSRYMRLVEAGVEVAIASGGSDGYQMMLLVRAGNLVAQGADRSAVWASLTSIPAKLLGLNQYGNLARGNSATMLLFEGDSPFDASGAFKAHKPK